MFLKKAKFLLFCISSTFLTSKRRQQKTFGSIVGCAPLPHCVSQFHDLDFLTAPTDPYVLCLHYLGKLYSSHSNPCTYLFMYKKQGVLIQGTYNYSTSKLFILFFQVEKELTATNSRQQTQPRCQVLGKLRLDRNGIWLPKLF